MRNLAFLLTNYILKQELIQKDDFEIYQYGFQTFLELFVNVICSIMIAVLLDMKLECFLFFLFFIPLRSYSGGLHMKHYLSCLILSCSTLFGVLLLVKYYTLKPILSFLLISVSLVSIKLIGPVNHPNRPVDADENTNFQKRTHLTLIACFVISVIFWIIGNERLLFLEALVLILVSFTAFIGKIKNPETIS